MRVVHSFLSKKIEKAVEEGVDFLISNKKGGYCFLSGKAVSRYQGVFFYENSLEIRGIFLMVNINKSVNLKIIWRCKTWETMRSKKYLVSILYLLHQKKPIVEEYWFLVLLISSTLPI